MTARARIQDLIGACALLPALLMALGGRAGALEVLGGPEPRPLLLNDNGPDLTDVAGSLGRVMFPNAPQESGDAAHQTVFTATLIASDLLLTTAHAFYHTDTDTAPGPIPGDLPRARMRAVCTIERETRAFRWIACHGMRFLPAFAPDHTETGERAVRHCLHFAAYPGADGLGQEAVCVLNRPAALSVSPLPLCPAETIDPSLPVLVPFMAQRQSRAQGTRWDAVVAEACQVIVDRSLLRPGSFVGPSGHALRHYCAIWRGGSGAPVLQRSATGGSLEIIGTHLGERYTRGDIVRQVGNRRFVAPHRFNGRTANVAVSTKRLAVLLEALD